VANINTHTNAMELADIFADGDFKLVAAHYSPIKTDLKLKVFKGASIIKESNLVDTPTALMSIYMDNLEPRVPGLFKININIQKS
jgi:Bardet-Biedl syndrome 1 protein